MAAAVVEKGAQIIDCPWPFAAAPFVLGAMPWVVRARVMANDRHRTGPQLAAAMAASLEIFIVKEVVDWPKRACLQMDQTPLIALNHQVWQDPVV